MATIEGVDVQVHRFTLFPAMVCLVLLLSACDSSQSTAGGTGASSSATGTGGAASSQSSPVGCVPNPEQVAAKPASPTEMTSPLPAELVGKLDAAARKAATQIAASGVIVGVRAPTGSWTAAYGQADPSTNAPMAVGMHTRIGSITKTFTGTLITMAYGILAGFLGMRLSKHMGVLNRISAVIFAGLAVRLVVK